MRFNWLLLILLPLMCLGTDWYIFSIIKRLQLGKTWRYIHIGLSCILYIAAIVALSLISSGADDLEFVASMWLMFIFLSFFIPKFIFVFFDLIGGIPLLFHKRRIDWLSICGASLGLIIFILFWWGALFNRYDLDVRRQEIAISSLPDSFEGYKIVQISDLHVGSYMQDTTFLTKVVSVINQTNPDVILFTGDMVSRHSEELEPFIEVLSRLKAKDGVFAVLGNHDYGKYYPKFHTDEERAKDVENLERLYSKTAFTLLRNDYRTIKRDDDSLVIIGVGNIGRPPFFSDGSLSLAYPEFKDNAVKILMSHDPSHWRDSIANQPESNIALTLSGHTHAMQSEIAGISPASVMHKYWSGLYHDNKGQQLYVNIGLGTVGLPARIGATPEITVFTLKKANN